MKWLSENWMLLLAALVCAGIAGVWFMKFIRLPKGQQLENVKQWLLWAVCEAEKLLGSGTGKLKLVMVYDMFVAQFPLLAEALTFEQFSELVNEALEEMRKLLASNAAVARAISVYQ